MEQDVFQAMMEFAPWPMAQVEGPKHILYAMNEAFAKLLGKDRRKLIGQPLDELLKGDKYCIPLMKRVLETGKWEAYTQAESEASAPVLWSYSCWPMQDSPRLGLMIQVTESGKFHSESAAINEALLINSIRQHELTERAQRRNSQLHEVIVQRDKSATKLHAANSELSDSDRRKNEFLATLAHELRNPLAPLLSGLEIISLPDCDPGTVERVHAMMGRQLQHMVGLIDDLMDLSRVSRGIVHIEKTRLDLGKVLTEAVESVRSRYDTLRHTLVLDLPKHPLEVDGDANRLLQVFSNLLTNAAKFTDQGGTITLRAAEESGELVVSVEDNGIGIAQEHLATVFEMFSQVDRTKQHAQGGLGIGLNIVKHMVDLHGGRVEVFSAGLGKGTRFTVFLPKTSVLDTAVEAVLPQQPEATQEFVRQRILLVDDNEDAANLLANILTHAGHETQVAFSGPQALGIGERMLPTVVLMDIGMPGMDGNATCRNMRLTPWGEAAFITAISGWGNEDDIRGTTMAGFDKHLVKPIGKKELLTLMDTVGELKPR